MAQPLYFLPHVTKAQLAPGGNPARSILAARGLADVFADVDRQNIGYAELNGRGPGNLSGIVVHYSSPVTDIPRRLGYYPDEQTWTPVGDGSQLWLGIDTASPPTPDDLRRKELHPGYRWELADGQEWQIPVIRRPDGTTGLPCDMIWDAAGTFQQPIKRAYERYWQDSEIIAEWAYPDEAGAKKELAVERMAELAVEALSINYRYGKNEQSLLRVIDATNFATVLLFSVDYPKFADVYQKKTEASTVNTSRGEAEPCAITDQPAPICNSAA